MVFIEDFFSHFFYSFPSNEPKPPISARDIPEGGVEIQFALAGFKEEDVLVWFEGRTLIVEGNNLAHEDIAARFQCSFSRRISIKENLDLDKAKISLHDGILAITLPLKDKEKEKKLLFGRSPK